MSVYDINGNEVITSGGNIKDAFLELVAEGEINLGSQVGAILAYRKAGYLDDVWITNATTAYNSLKVKYKELANESIPFFISTDQHGNGVEQHRFVNNIDTEGINVANINLGDTVTDYYNLSQLNSCLGRTKQVKNYIGVVGNHDALYRGSDIPSVYDITRYFMSTYSREVAIENNASYTVIDHKHKVKYVIVDTYSDVGTTLNGLTNNVLTTDLADWLIEELTKDEYDIVILQHWMLYALSGVYKRRDDTAVTDGIGGIQKLRTLLTARKNKTSGTITDDESVSHAYDFTSCEHELLCCLHGHQHEEMYATLDNLLCYVADWYGNYGSCVFGLVDRKNEKLRIWKFDNTQTYAEFVMDL